MTPARCADHPATVAVWTCAGCGRELCPACALPDSAVPELDARCARCDGHARRRMVPAPVTPGPLMLPTFARAMLAPEGLIRLILLAIGLAALTATPVDWCRVVALGGFALWLFTVLGSTMAGEVRLPSLRGTFQDGWSGTALPAVRFALGATIPALPMAAAAAILIAEAHTPLALLRQPAVLALGAVGSLIFPAVLILASTSDDLVTVLNPLRAASLVLRIPGAYAATVATWLGLMAADQLVGLGIDHAFFGLLPWVTPIVAAFAQLFFWTWSAMLFGWLIHANAARLGQPMTRDQLAPETPGVTPQAHLRS